MSPEIGGRRFTPTDYLPGAQASANLYGIPLANVYSAMAFYCDNEATIDEAIREARELGEQLGARAMQSAITEMKERLKAP